MCNDDEGIDRVMENITLVLALIKLIQCTDLEVFNAALRLTGNIISGDVIHTIVFMKYDLLDALVTAWTTF